MLGWSSRQELTWPAHGHEKLGTFFAEYTDFLHGEADQRMLADAMQRLSQRVMFGLTGDTKSLERILRAMEAGVSQLPHENQTPDTDYRVTSEDLEAIKRNNVLDFELYEFARHKLATTQT